MLQTLSLIFFQTDWYCIVLHHRHEGCSSSLTPLVCSREAVRGLELGDFPGVGRAWPLCVSVCLWPGDVRFYLPAAPTAGLVTNGAALLHMVGTASSADGQGGEGKNCAVCRRHGCGRWWRLAHSRMSLERRTSGMDGDGRCRSATRTDIRRRRDARTRLVLRPSPVSQRGTLERHTALRVVLGTRCGSVGTYFN